MWTRLAATASSASGAMLTAGVLARHGDDIGEGDGADPDNDLGIIHHCSICFRCVGAPDCTTSSTMGTPGR